MGLCIAREVKERKIDKEEKKDNYTTFDITLAIYEYSLFERWLEVENIDYFCEEHNSVPVKSYTYGINNKDYDRAYKTLLRLIQQAHH